MLDGAGVDYDAAKVHAWRADAGLLRLGDEQFRRPASPRCVSRAIHCRRIPRHSAKGSLARGRRQSGARSAAARPTRRAGFLGLRLQDPGQHGSAASGPHRFPPHLLGQIHARHDRDRTAHRQAACGFPPPTSFSRQERETVDEAYAGRRHRPGGPRGVRHRRHADGGSGDRVSRDPALSAGVLRVSAQSESRRSSSSSGRGWSSCCRKAWCRSSSCAMRCKRSRCSRRSVRCNSKSCSTGCKSEYGAPSELENASWEAFRWLAAGLIPRGSSCRPAAVWRRIRAASRGCFSRMRGRRSISWIRIRGEAAGVAGGRLAIVTRVRPFVHAVHRVHGRFRHVAVPRSARRLRARRTCRGHTPPSHGATSRENPLTTHPRD